jgi:hypothetical protein
MADWSQLLSGGAIGAVAVWLGGLLKTGFDHILEQRKRRAEEERAIRAEQREEARKQAERKQAEAERVQKDAADLLMYKTQMKGTTNLSTAGSIVSGIHSFFKERSQYLNAANRAFLQRYPGDFREQVCFAPERFPEPTTLAELKRSVETLQVTPICETDTTAERPARASAADPTMTS